MRSGSKSSLFEEISINDLTINYKHCLGKGGSSSVYSGRFKDKKVAIKIIESGEESDAEIAHLSKIAKEQIVGVVRSYGYAKTTIDSEAKCLIVMHYLPNGSLQDRLENKNLPPFTFEQCNEILLAISLTLHALHKNEILHCDIKAANILLDEKRVPKLCDFGSAEKMGSAGEVNTVGATANYAAPEVLTGKPYSTQAEVYSLGILMWTLFAWKAGPFDKGKDFTELGGLEWYYAVGKKTIQNARPKIPEDCPPKFAILMQLCWTASLKHRLTMRELLKELKTDIQDVSNILQYRWMIYRIHCKKEHLPFEDVEVPLDKKSASIQSTPFSFFDQEPLLRKRPYISLANWMLNHDVSPLDWAERYQVMRNSCAALAALHAQGKGVGCLSTQDILLSRTLDVKLRETANIKNVGVDVISAMEVKENNYTFLPLEVLATAEPLCTEKGNIFSLGAIIWCLVTWQHKPFAACNREQVFNKLGVGEKEEIPSYCPPEIAEIIQSCWDQDMSRRPTASELGLRLTALCEKASCAEKSDTEGMAPEMKGYVPGMK